ncbi:MAG: carboxypeptidase-like regulatory domain-containing protein, partial [Bacteroidales bacterium]
MEKQKQSKTKILKFMVSVFVLFVLPSIVLAQTKKSVSGSVTSAEDGEAMIGLTIIEKGTTNGTITDIDGKYEIELKGTTATLVFSMVGMISQEKVVNSGDILNIIMKGDQKLLDEVVVTGYSSQRKADLTGAVSIVSVDDLQKVAENN